MHGKRISRIAYLLLAMLLAASVAGGEEAATDARALQRQRLTEAHRRSIQRREAMERQRSGSSLHQFRGDDGTITFTNRPEKYRHRPDFVEVRVKYERIVVPKEYQKFTVPSEYTTSNIQDLIRRYARLSGLDEELIYAVIKCESNFNPDAVSPAGARGLMQLMPGTAAEMGVTRIFDPAQNIAGGTQYLMKMMQIFNRNKSLALAAYNAGPEAVKKYGGIPPYAETQAYVRKVLAYEKQFKRTPGSIKSRQLAKVRLARPAAAPAVADEKRYVVHFHSGLTQPADEVTDHDPYYYIEYGRRTYPVRKDLVAKIEEPA